MIICVIDAWSGKAVRVDYATLCTKITPYRFNEVACTEKFVHMIHTLAIWAAQVNGRGFSIVPTQKEVKEREQIAAAWNPPFAYNGD